MKDSADVLVLWVMPPQQDLFETHIAGQLQGVGARLKSAEQLDAALREAGLRLQRCSRGASIPSAESSALRVLPASSFSSVAQMQAEYQGPRQSEGPDTQAVPTLILAADLEQEAQLLLFAKPTDEVALEADPPKVLLGRLMRLMQRHAVSRQASEATFVDKLTGLYNRRHLLERVFPHWKETCRDDEQCGAVVMIDVDNVKLINDSFGHAVFDNSLRAVGLGMRKLMGPKDVAARASGDEFLCLVVRPTSDDVLRAADEIRLGVAAAVTSALPPRQGTRSSTQWLDSEYADQSRGAHWTVTASAGVACCSDGVDAFEVMQRAEQAVYAAKARGRNCVVTYESMREAAESAGEAGGAEDVRVQHFRNVTRVVTERVASLVSLMGKELVESAQREARRDKLTQLNNRAYFDRRIVREIELARKEARALSIAVFDLDRFGDFNHKYGIPVADQVLRIFAEIASSRIRPVDWLARYGGEEFCLVMPSTLEEAMNVAERVRVAVEAAPIQCPGQPTLHVTVSAGVTQFTAAMGDTDAFVQRASEALIEAKNAGRNCVRAKP
jgi:diguanylate cyclase (GGDEF)-like protein